MVTRTLPRRTASLAVFAVGVLLLLSIPRMTSRLVVNSVAISLVRESGMPGGLPATTALSQASWATLRDPSNDRAWWYRGYLELILAERTDAITSWRNSAYAFSGLEKRGQAALSKQDWVRAEDWFALALALRPESIEVLNGIGQAYAGQLKWSEAAQAYQQALQFAPQYEETYVHYAQMLLASNQDLELADTLLMQALDLNSNSELVFANLAKLAARKNGPEAALHWWQQAAAAALPGSVDSLLHLAETYGELGMESAAVEAYHRAVDQAPTSLSARIALAEAYGQVGDWASSLAVARAATEMSPNSLTPWAVLANAAMQLGDYAEAKKALAQAEQIDPNSPEVARLLALLDGH